MVGKWKSMDQTPTRNREGDFWGVAEALSGSELSER